MIERALAPARDVIKPFLASGLVLAVLGVKEGATNPVEMDGGSSSGSGASAE